MPTDPAPQVETRVETRTELVYRQGVLRERLRVMRILRDTPPRDAVQGNDMAHLCVELFRADLQEAVAEGT